MGRRHGGKGAGRSPSMSRRIFRNKSLGTATSASWNVTYRPWLTTLAPIFTNFSLSANILVQQHGEDGPMEAAVRTDQMFEALACEKPRSTGPRLRA